MLQTAEVYYLVLLIAKSTKCPNLYLCCGGDTVAAVSNGFGLRVHGARLYYQV